MGDMPIGKLLFRLSPPVMLALLIQSIYNIVDSYFVAQYSLSGLTALSLVFPIQLLATALSTGAGTGLGILIARMDGCGDTAAQRDTIKSGLWLGVFNFALFACVSLAVLQGYFALSSDQPMVRQQVIVPVVSFNHSAGAENRVRETLRWAVGISEAVMAAATAVFLLAPQALLRIFSASPSILATGAPALRIICLSFLPAGIAMTLTVFFQGSGQSRQSIFIIVLRQVVLLVPLAWVFHFAGLTYVWLTFPVTEVLSVLCALAFYRGAPFLSKRRNAE